MKQTNINCLLSGHSHSECPHYDRSAGLCVVSYEHALRGHFDKWLVYGAVTLRMSMGKYFPTSVSVSVCVSAQTCLCAEGDNALVIWLQACGPAHD